MQPLTRPWHSTRNLFRSIAASHAPKHLLSAVFGELTKREPRKGEFVARLVSLRHPQATQLSSRTSHYMLNGPLLPNIWQLVKNQRQTDKEVASTHTADFSRGNFVNKAEIALSALCI